VSVILRRTTLAMHSARAVGKFRMFSRDWIEILANYLRTLMQKWDAEIMLLR